MTKSQGEALTALLHQLRKDWDLAGIRSALRKAAPLGSPADIAIAACRCAANPDMRTPALIAEPGAHWLGTSAGKRQAPHMCTDHPAHPAGNCTECIALAVPRPLDFVVPRYDRRTQTYVAKDKMLTADPADIQRTRDRMDAS